MKHVIFVLAAVFFLSSCNNSKTKSCDAPTVQDYFNYTKEDTENGGVKMIPIETPKGTFKVWTKKIGNNPRIKILILHGGPALTHEYMECFQSFFPKE